MKKKNKPKTKTNSFFSHNLKAAFSPDPVCHGPASKRPGMVPALFPVVGARGSHRAVPHVNYILRHVCPSTFPTYLMLFSLSAIFSGTPDEQTAGFPHSRMAPGEGW